MNEQKKASPLNSSFYSHFYNEEVYLVKENEQTTPAGTATPAYQLPGSTEIIINGKQDADLLIMFENPKAAGMNPSDREFFINILKAAGRKPTEVAAINTATIKGGSWKEIAAATNARSVIAFGISENLLPKDINAGEVTEFSGKQILAIEALSTVSSDKEKKRVLWLGMQKLFNL